MNYIRIAKETIDSKPIWFIDEVCGNDVSNIASYDSEREANKRAYEIAREYDMEVMV
jgi:hypothetical protein